MQLVFSKSAPAPAGPLMTRNDFVAWWKQQPGVAERHRRELAPSVQVVRRMRGREVTKVVPGAVCWHNVPSVERLAERYARLHGACTWLRADDTCIGYWRVSGRIVRRKGRFE